MIALLAANPKMSKMQAALQAGYAHSTARNASKNVLDKPLVKTWLDNYRYTIEKAGLTQDRIASKLNELLDASNPIITMAGPLIDKKTGKQVMRPDRKIQLETVKVYHEIFGVKTNGESKNTEGLKRRMTLEEFEDKEGIQA
jgi:hypothetical protein